MRERWRSVAGWDGFYEVSDLGRVKSLARTITRSNGRKQTFQERILSSTPDPFGYPQVTLARVGHNEHARVHVLVCRSFRGPCPAGQEVRHKDSISSNCQLSNLHYGTRSQNHADKVRHGTAARGERNPQAALAQSEVISIRALYAAGGLFQKELADQYGVTQGTISMIVLRKTWAWL